MDGRRIVCACNSRGEMGRVNSQTLTWRLEQRTPLIIRSHTSHIDRHRGINQAKRYPLIMDFDKSVEQMDRQQLHTLAESVQVGACCDALERTGALS